MIWYDMMMAGWLTRESLASPHATDSNNHGLCELCERGPGVGALQGISAASATTGWRNSSSCSLLGNIFEGHLSVTKEQIMIVKFFLSLILTRNIMNKDTNTNEWWIIEIIDKSFLHFWHLTTRPLLNNVCNCTLKQTNRGRFLPSCRWNWMEMGRCMLPLVTCACFTLRLCCIARYTKITDQVNGLWRCGGGAATSKKIDDFSHLEIQLS